MNEWNGGVMPVPGGTLVRVRLRDCGRSVGPAERFLWGHSGDYPHAGEIIGWENLTVQGWKPYDPKDGLPCHRYAPAQVMHVDGAVFCDAADDLPWTNAVVWRRSPNLPAPVETPTLAPKLTAPAEFPHYFRDVRHLDHIDVYRVLSLYEVADPCIQHAIKKLLVAGGRGAKDTGKDVGEAIASLRRWEAMQAEGARA